MFKNFSKVLAGLMAAALLAGCGTVSPAASYAQASSKPVVLCTGFAHYDWVRSILGRRSNEIELVLLGAGATDLHSYQATTADMVQISSCDLLIYTGGESEEWVTTALQNAHNPNTTVLNMQEIIGSELLEEQQKEGMQGTLSAQNDGDDEDHDEEDHDEDNHSHEHQGTPYDEHVWLSVKNAAVICRAIEQQLAALDPAGAQVYSENLAAYLEQLNALDAEFAAAAKAANGQTLLFGDRFPFLYLMEDYDVDYYAAFPGCSAETQASFETIVYLSNKMDELSLPCILVLENSDGAVANAILTSSNTPNRPVLHMDSMQSVSATEIEQGCTYLSKMQQNLVVWKQALA